MTDTKPESLLPYEQWTEEALRQVVAQALAYVSEKGLPGEHHFYISFRTDYPGVVIPSRLRAQYPREMTIVLQHQFWDLQMDMDAGAMTVGLSFGGVPANLTIPLAAITGFADPHVQYGLRFEALPEPAPGATAAGLLPPTSEPSDKVPQVVSLDAFRRKTPPKE
ncbi:MAG: hypothetical protein JOY71_28300 [Acetobacteraceae bacterium]|nr:hypothetical protein [Acetobacteraceae bacterium]MBV8525968.1 hypothetical protein [Acetobacteraceae bacterium]